MNIKREDLAAAAAVGLLHYRQVEPLLIFLLQRNVRAQRLALAAQTRTPRRSSLQRALVYVGIVSVLAAMASFMLVFIMRGVPAGDIGGLFMFTLLYSVGALGLVAWVKRRDYGGRARLLLAVVLASVPLAVFALQQASG